MEVTVVRTDTKTLDQLIKIEQDKHPCASPMALARIVCRSLEPKSESRLLLEAMIGRFNAQGAQ